MRIKYLTNKAYETLLDNIAIDKEYYSRDDMWLLEYFEGKEFAKESRIDVSPITLYMDGDRNASDLINTRAIFDTFEELTPQQASNPYLWSYLSLVDFWKYSKWRWGRSDEDTTDMVLDGVVTPEETKRSVNIKQRYLCVPSRIGLLRNSLSRLWWYGYLTYQPNSPAHKYDLTKLLLSHSDLCSSVVERNFSMNRNITVGVLSAIQQINDEFPMQPVDRSLITGEYEWRDLCKYINRYGAVTLLDSLTADEIKAISYNYIINRRKQS